MTMMNYTRRRPKHLAEKLLQIRAALGLSQTEMHRELGVKDEISYTKISAYEQDKSEPTLTILLQYARAANVYMEALVDDDLDLPACLPSPTKSEGAPRRTYAGIRRT